MIDELKDLFFLRKKIHKISAATVSSTRDISQNQKFEMYWQQQEEKIKTYLEEKYPEKKSYYLSWAEIIDFLKGCLLDKSFLDEEDMNFVF